MGNSAYRKTLQRFCFLSHLSDRGTHRGGTGRGRQPGAWCGREDGRERRAAQLHEGALVTRQGGGLRRGVQRILQAHFPRLERPPDAHPGQDGRYPGIPAAALRPGKSALRPYDAAGSAQARPALVYQAHFHHGRLQGVAARLSAVRPGRGGFGGPAPEYLPGTASGKPPGTAHEQGYCGQNSGDVKSHARYGTGKISGLLERVRHRL
ncbi:MAG: hypothetical protein BWY09_01208 [Candidatus Hydrogenedentes bacterium ADurb.Bin179]|nr:MAG: hypothetical protein BWY09_01208 [Candidatus Hydrogenedentes bacterium ADurb.Bin179]